MQARYRTDYPGEFIVLETKWSHGKKEQTREWVANPIENHHISGRAACIASDIDIHRFDHTRLQNHRGGLLGSKKLQTYGSSLVSQSMRLDFTCESKIEKLLPLLESKYSDDNIVYTTTRNCLLHPGNWYIVPFRPNFLDVALLIYLAAFDGHKEIFLLGYNKETPVDNPGWSTQVDQIFLAYPGVKFFVVGEKTNFFDTWLEHSNVATLTHREFISYCDV